MRITAPAVRPWELNREEIDLVKNQICKGATDGELQLCLTVARRFRLDPLRGQIWFVPYGRNEERKWQPIVGINGLLHIAARDHKDFGSIDEPEYGPMVDVKWTRYEKGGRTTSGTIKAPEWAKVGATKKGMTTPTVAKVWFTEIYTEVAIGYSDKVRSMPRHMIGKVATAHAVRKAWPATDGLYIREEFQGPPEFTENGRAIVYPDKDTLDAPALDENARHGHAEGSRQAQIAEETLRRVEEQDAALRAKQAEKASPAPKEAAKPPLGTVELDFSADPAYLRGDLSNLLELIQKHTKCYWDGKENWWRVPASEVTTIREMCKQCNYALREIHQKASEAQGSAPEKKRPAERAGASFAEPRLVTATVERANIVLKGNKTMCFITLQDANKKKLEAGCWDKDIYERLEKVKGKGMACQVYIELRGQYTNIVGLKFIGAQEFMDGKIPVTQQKDREAGGKTLF